MLTFEDIYRVPQRGRPNERIVHEGEQDNEVRIVHVSSCNKNLSQKIKHN